MLGFHPPLFLEELRDALHPLTPTDCNALIYNKHIISKKLGKKIYYSRESLKSLQEAFNLNDYYTFAEVTDILNESNLSGYYDLFGYSINPINLIEHKYITLDTFIQKYISKKSLDKSIPVLLRTKANLEATQNKEKTQLELTKIIESKKEELLQPRRDKYLKDIIHSKLHKTELTVDEPKLSDEELLQIKKEAYEEQQHYIQIQKDTGLPWHPKAKPRSLKKCRRPKIIKSRKK